MKNNWDILSIILGCVAALLIVLWRHSKSKYKLPPGPWGLPVVGYIPFMGKYPFKTFIKLSEKYGKVFSLNLGGHYTVILNDFESVKDAFSNNAILDRPPHLFDFHPDGLGFTGYNGKKWLEQRRHTMRTLKDVGLGKIPWESCVEAEVEDFIQFLEEQGGKPLDVFDPLSASVSNNMTSIILGKRLLKGDPRRRTVDDGVQAVINTFVSVSLVFLFPRLSRFFAKFGLTKKSEDYQKMVRFNRFIRNEMESRKKIPQIELNEDIFIDGYLLEKEKLKEKGVENWYNENNLVGTSQALIVGGSDTSRTLLCWLFLAMVTYPDIQKKIQKEIDVVLGKDGKLKWAERAKLPLTYAATLEVHRWRTIAPLGAVHQAAQDTNIGDYDIPKGTHVISNIYALHNDPKYWKDPDVFRPERFLHEDGSLKMQRLDSYAPFSLGKHSYCCCFFSEK
ncbi:Cytochrome P450 2J6 like protein [Argiope bruennichi]|uniref:Cytochrome P450 2J6 like protein n=1 Tax=Argiope bruennichi TaxID=94029 RepID=A0A8T0EXQ6_ARGBR|nr:Cytochrome P450 2J6 like protein [Argiope bruennichi]